VDIAREVRSEGNAMASGQFTGFVRGLSLLIARRS
jgi:hypothetical protein